MLARTASASIWAVASPTAGSVVASLETTPFPVASALVIDAKSTIGNRPAIGVAPGT